ncbi:MAG: hypothetical protein ACQEQE_06300 [Bacillota bacterium]
MENIEVLKEIAKLFNEKDIRWAIGGSTLLYFYDILENPNDLDIIINPKDKNKVFNILDKLGESVESEPVKNYKTGVFKKYYIEDVEIDIIGDFYIKTKDGYYLHPFDQLDTTKKVIEGVTVYLDSLINWKKTYKMMGDPKKRVKLIENYLN